MTGEGRGRAWAGVLALALATAVLSVVQAALLIFLPLALLMVALPPRHPVHIALAVFIGWMTLRVIPSADTLWYFGRGWALLLGAWFVILIALQPSWKFLPRALSAVAATAATAALIMLVGGDGFAALDAGVSARLRMAVEQMVAAWRQMAGPDGIREDIARTAYTAAALQARLFPATIALASLSGLGVAWWAFSRVALGESRPLGRLREFSFRDELVWLFIGGMVLMLLPIGLPTTRLGENLAAFMAVLYAVRGAGVLMSIGTAPGPIGIVIGTVLFLMVAPFVMATTFLVGLSDTWLDIRARRAASTGSGS